MHVILSQFRAGPRPVLFRFFIVCVVDLMSYKRSLISFQDPQPALIRSVTMPTERSTTPPPLLTTCTSAIEEHHDVTDSDSDTDSTSSSSSSSTSSSRPTVTSATLPAPTKTSLTSSLRSRSPTSSLLLNGRSKNETDERKVREKLLETSSETWLFQFFSHVKPPRRSSSQEISFCIGEIISEILHS